MLLRNNTVEWPVKMLIDVERGIRVRYFPCFWLFVLSAVAFLDRTNIASMVSNPTAS